MPKEYERDGPPQLRGLTDHVIAAERALLMGSSEFAHLLDIDDCWRRKLRCLCGNADFRILRGDSETAGWISGKYGGNQRVRAECLKCRAAHLIFDDGLHGYNAVICEDRASLPPHCDRNNDALLKAFACTCGNGVSNIFVAAVYDCLDPHELPEIDSSKRDDAYGYFVAVAACTSCHAIREIVSHETA